MSGIARMRPERPAGVRAGVCVCVCVCCDWHMYVHVMRASEMHTEFMYPHVLATLGSRAYAQKVQLQRKCSSTLTHQTKTDRDRQRQTETDREIQGKKEKESWRFKATSKNISHKHAQKHTCKIPERKSGIRELIRSCAAHGEPLWFVCHVFKASPCIRDNRTLFLGPVEHKE